MKVYKVIPASDTIVLKKRASALNALNDYFEVINRECVNGWEFVNVSTIRVLRKVGGIKKTKQEAYNVFVFAKEDPVIKDVAESKKSEDAPNNAPIINFTVAPETEEE